MKNFIIPCLLFYIVSTLTPITAQTCGASGITLNNQAAVDNFTVNHPGCTQILGNLSIGGTVNNLNGLSVLTSVGGQTSITGNVLTSLGGLSNLTAIGAALSISGTVILPDFTGLSNLTSAGSIQVNNNKALTSLTGLSGITSTGYVNLGNNDMLTSLTGLNNLTSLSTNFSVNSNDALTNLQGVNSLSSIGGAVSITNNSALQNLAGLNSLTTIGGTFDIYHNNSIVNFTGLSALTSIGEAFNIYNNNSLTDFTGTSALQSIGLGIEINNNNNLVSLSGLSSLTTLGGAFSVNSNPGLTTLSGVSSLYAVGGALYISNDHALVNLNGLNALHSIGSYLTIGNCAVLSDISALLNLVSVAGNVDVEANPALTSLTGLDNIDPAGIYSLFLETSTSLSYCGVPSICQYLSDPDSLPYAICCNASGCSAKATILSACGVLPIALVSFTGNKSGKKNILSWITLNERDNDHFDIERSANGIAFEKIGSVQGEENIATSKRYSFDDLHPLMGVNYYRLKQVDRSGNFEYSKAIELNADDRFNIHPNPANSALYVEAKEEGAAFSISNVYGQRVQTGNLRADQPVDISNLRTGLYYIFFEHEARRFIKQ